MKKLLICGLLTMSAAFGQTDAFGRPITKGSIPLDASGRPMFERLMAGKALQQRALEFNRAWARFIAPTEGPRMSDYVHACEAAKVMFPMLHGDCQDSKALLRVFHGK